MKEQGIKWKKTYGNNQYIDDDFEKWVALVSKVLFDVVCALIFTCSARLMLSDVYYWGEFSVENLWEITIIAIIISVVMEFADISKKWLKYIIQWGVLLTGTLIIIHFISNGEEIEGLLSGIQKMMGSYIDDWNIYYQTGIIYVTGKLVHVTESLNFITIVLFFVLFWMTKMLKNNLVMAILPALILSLELLVGHSPEYQGLMLLFIGVLLSNTSKWTTPDFSMAPGRKYISVGSIRFFSWVVIGVVIYVLCGIVKNVGTTKAEEMIYYSDDIKQMYNEVVEGISEMTVWDVFNGEGDSNTEELNNDTPKYTGKEILELNIWSKPKGNIYLKGYYAESYQNGVWRNNYKDFEKACENAGFDLNEVSNNISMMSLEKVLDNSDVRKLNESAFGYSAIITYLEKTGKKAYMPYFFEFENDDELEISFEGDGRYRKKSDLNEMSLTIWAYSGKYESNLLMVPEGANEKWQDWYEKYVLLEYMDVPENMENVQKIAKEIRAWSQFENEIGIWENQKRLYFGESVAKWMQKNTVYTLNPPDLPEDIDPIEYFLGDSKRGYCMHFASASVMILRELGVPARYASGYIVKNDAYENIQGNYVAKVVDKNAHAWVEIYLNDVGWVPVEVTKGYNSDVINAEKPSNPSNIATTKPNVPDTTKENDTTKDQNHETETTKEVETTSKYVGNQGEEPSGGGNGVGNTNDISSEKKNNTKKIIRIIFALLLVSGVVFGIELYKNLYHKRLEKELHEQRALNAIRMINSRIYKKLRRRGKVFKLNLRDDEYKKRLVASYPQIESEDWEKFMDIVKAAAFSKREFSVEEMYFCYNIYSQIMIE